MRVLQFKASEAMHAASSRQSRLKQKHFLPDYYKINLLYSFGSTCGKMIAITVFNKFNSMPFGITFGNIALCFSNIALLAQRVSEIFPFGTKVCQIPTKIIKTQSKIN